MPASGGRGAGTQWSGVEDEQGREGGAERAAEAVAQVAPDHGDGLRQVLEALGDTDIK
ncbi:hypothetical protein GCM10018773_29620 [Streptomyces candidus]|nr:hypothetical protein GCM10018773_29620 [Streptomyces candidus]